MNKLCMINYLIENISQFLADSDYQRERVVFLLKSADTRIRRPILLSRCNHRSSWYIISKAQFFSLEAWKILKFSTISLKAEKKWQKR